MISGELLQPQENQPKGNSLTKSFAGKRKLLSCVNICSNLNRINWLRALENGLIYLQSLMSKVAGCNTAGEGVACHSCVAGTLPVTILKKMPR